jgi:hypothetical protein
MLSYHLVYYMLNLEIMFLVEFNDNFITQICLFSQFKEHNIHLFKNSSSCGLRDAGRRRRRHYKALRSLFESSYFVEYRHLIFYDYLTPNC